MSTSLPDIQSYRLTTVIATLGGDSLRGTIEALNCGTKVPDEILICIPANEVHKVSDFDFPNVKLIVTETRGQVLQRAIGFKNAKNDIVMQLDDDVCVDTHCVEQLLKTLNAEGPMVAVAPSFLCMSSGDSIYKRDGNSKLLPLFYWLVNGKAGYQPGTIGLSGVCFGVDPKADGKRIHDVEWVPGGCVVHCRENLVLENYYPFKGKAYGEDLIHSLILTQSIEIRAVSGTVPRGEYYGSMAWSFKT